MKKFYDILTFDCYGTLIDWEEGIAEAFLSAARQDGVRLEQEAVLAAYARLEPQVESEGYREYRLVLVETALRVAAELGWPLPAGPAEVLSESLPGWFP